MKLITQQIMENEGNYFKLGLLCGILVFPLFVLTNTVIAQTGNNATVTEKLLGGKTIKLIVFSRTKQLDAEPVSNPAGDVQCHDDESVTGGGFKLANPLLSTIVSSNKMDNGWAVSFANAADKPASATIFAQCAHLELGP
jgi:hypothetical protein